MNRSLALLSLVFFPALSAAADEERTPKTYDIKQSLDIAYTPGAGGRQKLDVFAPKGANGEKFPVVIFAHGGTWLFGDKNFFGVYRKAGQNLAKHGVVAVMINYRLSPFVKHPEHTRDAARSFAWTVKNIDRYGGDPERIVLGGHSAGADLMSLLATDSGYLKDAKLKLTDSDRKSIKGVVCLSGVYRVPDDDDYQVMIEPFLRSMVGEPNQGWCSFMRPVLRKVGNGVNPFPWIFGTDRDVCRYASPLCHVRKGLPPFLLLTADREVPRLRSMADEFEQALKKKGNDVVYKDLDAYTHQTLINQLHTNDNEVCKLVLDFVAKHTGKVEKRGK